ncbi:MAG: hypothetical protein M3300_06315 [Actinomycetota bacterium]|nr:hypothetical protein [Actinomycetota bacterium]
MRRRGTAAVVDDAALVPARPLPPSTLVAFQHTSSGLTGAEAGVERRRCRRESRSNASVITMVIDSARCRG